jgi:hypothetical protein
MLDRPNMFFDKEMLKRVSDEISDNPSQQHIKTIDSPPFDFLGVPAMSNMVLKMTKDK